jgi:hypothetical protein
MMMMVHEPGVGSCRNGGLGRNLRQVPQTACMHMFAGVGLGVLVVSCDVM